MTRLNVADYAEPRMWALVPRPFSYSRVGSGNETRSAEEVRTLRNNHVTKECIHDVRAFAAKIGLPK